MLKNERGVALVLVSVTLFAFVSLFALVADLGRIYVTKSELQNAADSAALAAVVEIPKGVNTARTKALDFAQSHWAAGKQISITASDIFFGHYDFILQEFSPGGIPVNGVLVEAERITGSGAGPVPLFFAPIFGKHTSDVRAISRAVLDPHVVGVHGKNRLIPYSVIDHVVDQDRDGLFDIGAIVNIRPKTDAPGNFGFLNLDGGSSGTPELRKYIENGYDKDFIIPPGGSVEVSGSTGIEGNSLLNSFNVILGEVVFLPVHNWVINPGDNAIFNVISILAVRITQVKLTGSAHTRFIRVEIINYASSVLVTDPNAPANNSVAKPRLVA